MTAWPWPSSESTDKVIPALVEALQGVEDVVRNKAVNAGQMRYTYAELGAVLDAAKPVLTSNGLAITQAATDAGVHALVLHTSGEWLSFPPLHVATQQGTPQGQGSALSFARRYQLLALLNIATEDDDGRAASKPPKAAQKPADAPQPPTEPVDVSMTAAHSPAPSAQVRLMMKLFSNLNITDRKERLDYCSATIGRTIASSNELTPKERSAVIDALKAIQPVDDGTLRLVPDEAS